MRKLSDFVPNHWGPSPVTGRSRCDYTVPGEQVEALAGRGLGKRRSKTEQLLDVCAGKELRFSATQRTYRASPSVWCMSAGPPWRFPRRSDRRGAPGLGTFSVSLAQ